ncbi:MAG: tetratricopeptide repeat protein [Gemmatimonadetes bacterium]|nr:tetratricopeptide repeat protein [Gemmatimonadota bacterium]
MNGRLGVALSLSLVLAAGACASATTAGGGGAAEAANEPRNNAFTRSATLFLAQANAASPETRSGLYQQALNAATQSVQTEPENPMGWFMAAQAQAGLGNYEAADSAFDKAEELYPAYTQETAPERERAWIEAYNSAVGQLQQGNEQGSLEFFQRAALIYGGRPEAHLNVGATQANMGNDSAAIDAFAEALDIIRTADRTGLDSATTAQWRENEEIAAFNMAQLLTRQTRYEEAAAAYRQYLQSDPDNIMAKTNLAVALMNLNQQAEAEAIYDELLSRSDMEERDFFVVGVGLFQVEAYERSADAFRRAVERNPQSRDSRYNLSQALYQIADSLQRADSVQARGAWQALIPDARRVVECDPYNRNALLILAQSLARTGQTQEAVTILERHRDIPFSIENLDFRSDAEGGPTVRGSLINHTSQQGTPITLRFRFVGPNGQQIGTSDVTVRAPATDYDTPFEVQLQSTQQAAGYCYNVPG